MLGVFQNNVYVAFTTKHAHFVRVRSKARVVDAKSLVRANLIICFLSYYTKDGSGKFYTCICTSGDISQKLNVQQHFIFVN